MRHAKRDEEAGGPGLGVLDTRKRTRRLPDGTIVTRPTKRQSRAAAARAAATGGNDTSNNNKDNAPSPMYTSSDNGGGSCSDSGRVADMAQIQSSLSDCSANFHHHHHHYDIPPDGAPMSPPRSTNASGRFSSSSESLENEALDASIGIDSDEPLLAPMMPGGPYEPFVEPIAGQFDVADGAWQTDTMLSTAMDLDYDDTFNLDTGMSLAGLCAWFKASTDDDLKQLHSTCPLPPPTITIGFLMHLR